MALLDILNPIMRIIPEVAPPQRVISLKEKLMWSLFALALFFILGKITVLGIIPGESAAGNLENLQVILASSIGSLITAGIGPIVLSSIILQLLIGGKIFPLDLGTQEGKATFQSLQKILAIVLSFFEGFIYPVSGMLVPQEGMLIFVGVQIAIGSIILLYLDEVVSKYGLGSGIGLFIAGGVAGQFFWAVFMPPGVSSSAPVGGIIFQFISSLSSGANFLLLFPIVMFILIFLVIVYAEGMHINIPITMGAKGFGGRYPVKLMYVSNMPVILAAALFANLQLWAAVAKGVPYLNSFLNALVWATSSQYNLISTLILQIYFEGFNALITLQGVIFQEIVYLIIFISACVIFGVFWVELGGQGSANIARQLQSSGMFIPGFRRDERILKQILDIYIPTITILGSIFVALLAGVGDMVLGNIASGTGILLTVGIVYRMYEELAKDEFVKANPMLAKFFR